MPAPLLFTKLYIPPPSSICCAAREAAKLSKTPCDPLEDADYDGRLNSLDSYPLDPVR